MFLVLREKTAMQRVKDGDEAIQMVPELLPQPVPAPVPSPQASTSTPVASVAIGQEKSRGLKRDASDVSCVPSPKKR